MFMLTGSMGADVRSFLPMFLINHTYDTLAEATQAAVDLINRDLTEFGDGDHLKTGHLSWEILDHHGNSWERVNIKEIQRDLNGDGEKRLINKIVGGLFYFSYSQI